jgi:hypothetical protein
VVVVLQLSSLEETNKFTKNTEISKISEDLTHRCTVLSNQQDEATSHMREIGDPLDSLPAGILADVLGRVADTGDIAACRLASRALLAASFYCSRVRLSAAARARRLRLREGEGGHGGTTFRAAAGNIASLLGPHLRSLALDASEEQGFPGEDGEGEGDGLHLTSGESVTAWAATAAGPTLQEVDIADFSSPRWRKAEGLPVISHFCQYRFSKQ